MQDIDDNSSSDPLGGSSLPNPLARPECPEWRSAERGYSLPLRSYPNSAVPGNRVSLGVRQAASRLASGLTQGLGHPFQKSGC